MNSGKAELRKETISGAALCKMAPSSIIPALEANSRREKAQGGRAADGKYNSHGTDCVGKGHDVSPQGQDCVYRSPGSEHCTVRLVPFFLLSLLVKISGHSQISTKQKCYRSVAARVRQREYVPEKGEVLRATTAHFPFSIFSLAF